MAIRRTPVRSGDLDRRLLDAVERLGQGLRAQAQATSRAEGLSPLQQQIVLALASLPQGRHEVGALAAECDVTVPTMSDAVSALERKQLVTRSASPDGRRRLLSLTRTGSRTAQALRSWDAPALDALRGLDHHSKGVALEVMLAVIATLVEEGTISVARVCTTCRHFQPRLRGGDDPWCALLKQSLPATSLRVDCPEHEPASR